VIFIDEVDALFSKRNSEETEHTRRLKNEFLTQFTQDRNVTIVAATNIPKSLDEAFLRRFQVKILVPLPEDDARRTLIERNIKIFARNHHVELDEKGINYIIDRTKGATCGDINQLFRSAKDNMIAEFISNNPRPIFRPNFCLRLAHFEKSTFSPSVPRDSVILVECKEFENENGMKLLSDNIRVQATNKEEEKKKAAEASLRNSGSRHRATASGKEKSNSSSGLASRLYEANKNCIIC